MWLPLETSRAHAPLRCQVSEGSFPKLEKTDQVLNRIYLNVERTSALFCMRRTHTEALGYLSGWHQLSRLGTKDYSSYI
jgi:hypothetical protein